ncbi:LysR family transcriptional regulator [Ferrimonas aestuarii]|uniref:LysR family transcriptional regulator n=1 Tax=Ferrimonas aestuarii TaxID=2569539 RepID=A0A4U1BUL7_9GAMM|nr:LysR family transcriptional regulator [Ferrimonas aestuarii]TKB56511.1 LysR family transcriptional regulator [Ferrimonas aestuarii]
MTITLEQMKIIQAAAESGSFSAAARKLGKAQSTISSVISNIEQEVGIRLFDRGTKYPVLTDVGKDLLEHINALVAQSNNLEGKLNALAVDIESELSVIVDAAIPDRTLLNSIADFYQYFPFVNLHLATPSEYNPIEAVLSGECHMALILTRPDYPMGVEFCRLGTLKMVEVVEKDHPLVAMQPVSFSDLSNFRQLIFAPHGRNLLTSEYLKSCQRFYTDSYEFLLKMTLAAQGWTAVPEDIVKPYLRSGKLVELVLKSYPHTLWEVGVDLIWNRETSRGPAAEWLIKRISERGINHDSP